VSGQRVAPGKNAVAEAAAWVVTVQQSSARFLEVLPHILQKGAVGTAAEVLPELRAADPPVPAGISEWQKTDLATGFILPCTENLGRL
jgi:hypothetical protein